MLLNFSLDASMKAFRNHVKLTDLLIQAIAYGAKGVTVFDRFKAGPGVVELALQCALQASAAVSEDLGGFEEVGNGGFGGGCSGGSLGVPQRPCRRGWP